jgi:hypothetical protein
MLQLQQANAQSLSWQLSLDAYLFGRTPRVSSYSNAVLFDNNGQRVYRRVSLRHQLVADFGSSWETTVVNDSGYANSLLPHAGSNGALIGACYVAAMVAQQVEYSLLVGPIVRGPACIPEPPDPPPPPPDENCPVVIDLALNGFHLSGPEPAGAIRP